MAEKILIVPGYRGSGEAHWQTWLEGKLPNCQRVTGIDWNTPSLPRWAEKIGQAIDASKDPVWIVAHSFGALASTVAIAHQPSKIAGAILVAPADPERFAIAGLRDSGDRVAQPSIASLLPQDKLHINGLLIASENDPWLALDDARELAKRWHFPLLNAGRAGHINVDSGHGPWPFLLSMLNALRFETGRVENLAPTRLARVLPFRASKRQDLPALAYL
jgi:uncharacterized protein